MIAEIVWSSKWNNLYSAAMLFCLWQSNFSQSSAHLLIDLWCVMNANKHWNLRNALRRSCVACDKNSWLLTIPPNDINNLRLASTLPFFDDVLTCVRSPNTALGKPSVSNHLVFQSRTIICEKRRVLNDVWFSKCDPLLSREPNHSFCTHTPSLGDNF